MRTSTATSGPDHKNDVPTNSDDDSRKSGNDGSANVENGVPNNRHKRITWVQAVFVLIAETISLGVLSLPAAVSALGMVVGAIMIDLISECVRSTRVEEWEANGM